MTRGKMSPAHCWAEEGGGGEARGNCADTAESAFEIFISSAPRRRGRARDLNADEPGPPALPCPRHCASAASDPHSWGLMGGGGGTGQRLRSTQPDSRSVLQEALAGCVCHWWPHGGRGWKLRHREDRDSLDPASQEQPNRPGLSSLPGRWVLSRWLMLVPRKSPIGVDTGDPQAEHGPLATSQPCLCLGHLAGPCQDGPRTGLASPYSNLGCPNPDREGRWAGTDTALPTSKAPSPSWPLSTHLQLHHKVDPSGHAPSGHAHLQLQVSP